MKNKGVESFQIVKAIPTRPLGPVTRHWEPIIAALKPGQCIQYRGPRIARSWLAMGYALRIPLTTQKQPDGTLHIWKREGCPNVRAIRSQQCVNRKS